MEFPVTAQMCDGDGDEISYQCIVEADRHGFHLKRVTRTDTNEDVNPQAFSICFGKSALEKLGTEIYESLEGIQESRELEQAEARAELKREKTMMPAPGQG